MFNAHIPVLTWIISASLLGGVLSVICAGFVALNARTQWIPMLISYAIGAMLGAVLGWRMAGAARAGARLAPLSDSDEERENVSTRAKQECVEGVSERAQLAALPQAAAAASS
jgi:membrane protein YqaA with SNARE-associated domain